jgi:hypothetical protein
MKFNPLTPFKVSGNYTVSDDQVTQIFGNASDGPQKFTLTFPIPKKCEVKGRLVYYDKIVVGKVNEFDDTKVDVCNFELVSFESNDDKVSIEFKQV